jgi:hypothetical protein
VWETPETEGIFCEHLDVFSETWPISGSMRNGVAYALPTWDPATPASESSSLLLTPVASEGIKPSNTMGVQRRLTTGQVFLTNQIVTLCGLDPSEKMLLKTPTSQLAVNGGSQHPDKRKAGGHGPTLADEVEHLLGEPTSPPSDAGKLDSEGQLLGQQNLLDAIKASD